MKKIVLRIVGGNGGGGVRKYCYQLNQHLKSRSIATKTFIPAPLFADPLSARELVRLDYDHQYRFSHLLIWVLRNRNKIEYIHSHQRIATLYGDILSRIFGLPHVITVHGPLYSGPPSPKDVVVCYLFGRALMRARQVIYISQYTAIVANRQSYVSANAVKSRVVHNGSDDPGPPSTRSIEDAKFKVCVVGELTPRKNVADILWLASEISERKLDVCLEIYGTGPLRTQIEAGAVSFDCLIYRGYVTDARQIFSAKDLHIILSKDEGFGRVVTEAMSFGVPTLCYRSGAFPEMISDGVDGRLVDGRADLIAALDGLVRDRSAVCHMGAAARDTFLRRFTVARFCEDTFSAIYDDVAAADNRT